MNNNDYQNEILKLKKQVERLKKSVKKQKYGLVWMDVPEAFEDDVENKLPVLKEVPELAIKNDDGKPTHILIEGDNYHALTCLNYTHKGKVDVIYIDPPYNTTSDGFKYKDKRVIDKYPDGTTVDVNSPFRHSYWLSFLHKRLELSKSLLSSDGIIFISIDYHEFAQLKLLCNEIFGEDNFLAHLIWRGMHTTRNSSKDFNQNTEYILVYAKNKSQLIIAGDSDTYLRFFKDKSSSYPFDDNDGNGKYKLDPIYARNFYEPYEVEFPNGVKWSAPRGNYPRYSKTNLLRMYEEGLIIFSGKEPKAKRYLRNVKEGVPPDTLLPSDIVGFNKDGTSLLNYMFEGRKVFDQPKPVALIKYLLSISSKKKKSKQKQIILDFFAGSGTTGQAVMELNEEDGLNRQCILITNNENNIMTDVCYPRQKKVVEGYTYLGTIKKVLFREKISFKTLANAQRINEEVNLIAETSTNKWEKLIKKVVGNELQIIGENRRSNKIEGLGNSLKFYRTSFVGNRNILNIKDEDKVELAHNAGELLALSENTLDLINKDDWMQLYESNDRYTAIYFREEMTNFEKFKNDVKKLDKPVSIYVFSWGDNEFPDDFAEIKDAKVKTIPAPILEIYKQIYNLNTK